MLVRRNQGEILALRLGDEEAAEGVAMMEGEQRDAFAVFRPEGLPK